MSVLIIICTVFGGSMLAGIGFIAGITFARVYSVSGCPVCDGNSVDEFLDNMYDHFHGGKK